MRRKTNRRINRTRNSRRTTRLSESAFRRLVLQEAEKLSGELEAVEDVDVEEVDADGYADTLEQDLDIYKAMKVQEARLVRQHQKMVKEVRKIRKRKQLAKKRILRKLK